MKSLRASLRRLWHRLSKPRLLIALLALTAASLAIGAAMSSSQPAGREYLAARHALMPNHPLEVADLVGIRVDVSENPATYLEQSDLVSLLRRSALAPRSLIVAGQFVRFADLVNPAKVTTTQIMVPLALAPPDSVQPGDLVDLWATATTPGAEPTLVAESAQVVGFATASSGLGSSSRATAQLLVDQSAVSAILAAVAASDQLVIVPVFGGHLAASR